MTDIPTEQAQSYQQSRHTKLSAADRAYRQNHKIVMQNRAIIEAEEPSLDHRQPIGQSLPQALTRDSCTFDSETDVH